MTLLREVPVPHESLPTDTAGAIDAAGAADADPATPALQAQGVHVRLGGQPVLHGIDLSQPAGSVLALMGANGSGKTTLVRAVLGLVPLERGDVRLFGTEVRRFRHWSWIGYVPQRSSLSLRNATVGEIVMSGRLGHRRLLLPASRTDRAQVADALERVGLPGRQPEEMVHLSGGQQQRVLIARALAAEPRLLVMDEPLAGVDHESQHAMADVLAALVRDGLTATIVLHELGPLGPLLDRAVVLEDGHLSHDGPVSDRLGGGGHESHELTDHETPARAFLDHPVTPEHRHEG